jgi:hypothetical protein
VFPVVPVFSSLIPLPDLVMDDNWNFAYFYRNCKKIGQAAARKNNHPTSKIGGNYTTARGQSPEDRNYLSSHFL